jgi:hypothetical protein
VCANVIQKYETKMWSDCAKTLRRCLGCCVRFAILLVWNACRGGRGGGRDMVDAGDPHVQK